MLLEELYKHSRDSNLTFNEERHEYKLISTPEKQITSCTTVIKKAFREFDAESVVKKMMKSRSWTVHKLYGKTKEEILSIWEQNGNEASQKGTKLHDDIERYLNQEEITNDSIEFTFFHNFMKERMLGKVYRTEWRIYDENLSIAGSIDMCSSIDDDHKKLVLYDWKRCKIKRNECFQNSSFSGLEHLPDNNYFHYCLQLNLYRYILIKNYDVDIEGMYLVGLHPENFNSSYILYSVPVLEKEIEILLQQYRTE